jgi:hypothetical protein
MLNGLLIFTLKILMHLEPSPSFDLTNPEVLDLGLVLVVLETRLVETVVAPGIKIIISLDHHPRAMFVLDVRRKVSWF